MTIALFAIMLLTFFTIKSVNMFRGEDSVENIAPSLDEIIEQFVPNPEDAERLFGNSLDSDELSNEEVGFAGFDSELVRAIISKPAGEGPFAGVLFIHDSPSSERATDKLHAQVGDPLSKELGVVTMTVDWRESDFGEEDLTDVLSALDWFTNLPEFDGQPIITVGIGHGALLGLLAAEEKYYLTDAMISIYGINDPQKHYEYLLNIDPNAARRYLANSGCVVALNPSSCLKKLRIVEKDEAPIEMPMLFMHDPDDRYINFEQTQILADVLDPKTTTVFTFGKDITETEEGDGETVIEEGINEDTKTIDEESDGAEETIVIDSRFLESDAAAGFSEAYAYMSDWIRDQVENFGGEVITEESGEKTEGGTSSEEIEDISGNEPIIIQ